MDKPLAWRMRPTNLDEVIGQKHLVGDESKLRRMIEANRLTSMILFGPPGIGKTSIAKAIAGTANLPFYELNAVSSGKKDMEKVVAELPGQTKLLLFEEFHRLNKGQQDYLLPYMEEGELIVVACTTESIFHQINPAIRSRSEIFELFPLHEEEIREGIVRAVEDKEKGLGNLNIFLDKEALNHFVTSCGGDMRSALSSLEIAALSTEKDVNGTIKITLEIAEEVLQRKSFTHDKDGDSHYNVLSALQKSIRGSDLDASYHYMARLIEAGDLVSLCRRISIIAYEDIGVANVELCGRVNAALEVCMKTGFPEARIPLAVIVLELCLSPKSNTAYQALDRALEDVRNNNIGEIPSHLKDSHYKGAASLGRGVGYKYPHDYGGYVRQQYLPDVLKDRQYYRPLMKGKEEILGKTYFKLHELKKD